MSVDTKGIVATPIKDVFFVSSLIEGALNTMIRTGARKAFPNASWLKPEVKDNYKPVDVRLSPSSDAGMLVYDFTYHGERRSLNAFFSCDCDNTKIAPKSLSFSIGCWGDSEEIMSQVLESVSLLGEAYIDVNDCDDIGYEPVDSDKTTHTLLEALAKSFMSPYGVEQAVRSFFDPGEDNNPLVGSFEHFVGIPREHYDLIQTQQDVSARWSEIENLARKLRAARNEKRAELTRDR